MEVQSARGLDGQGRLGLREGARTALQRTARQRLQLDRMRPLHPAGERPRRPLGGPGQDGVRLARMTATAATPILRADGMSYEISHLRALESEAIHIMREVAAELERAVLLFSGGK